MATKFDRVGTHCEALPLIKSHNLWSHSLSKSRDNLKPSFLHNYIAYDHQTWMDGDLPWGKRVIIVTCPFNHMVLLDHLTNLKHYNCTTSISMATKRSTVVTYHEELSLIKWFDPSITRFNEVTWHIKGFIFVIAINQWPPNMTRWWPTVRGFHL